jgi:AAA+ ATPase superfamily predicted ATPase
LRKHSSTGGDWVDVVFRVSDVVPDTKEIRERLEIDVGNYRTAIRNYYFELELMRLPSGAKDFKHLAGKMSRSKERNYVIGWVLEVVTKMYRVHMESLKIGTVETESTNQDGRA